MATFTPFNLFYNSMNSKTLTVFIFNYYSSMNFVIFMGCVSGYLRRDIQKENELFKE